MPCVYVFVCLKYLGWFMSHCLNLCIWRFNSSLSMSLHTHTHIYTSLYLSLPIYPSISLPTFPYIRPCLPQMHKALQARAQTPPRFRSDKPSVYIENMFGLTNDNEQDFSTRVVSPTYDPTYDDSPRSLSGMSMCGCECESEGPRGSVWSSTWSRKRFVRPGLISCMYTCTYIHVCTYTAQPFTPPRGRQGHLPARGIFLHVIHRNSGVVGACSWRCVMLCRRASLSWSCISEGKEEFCCMSLLRPSVFFF